MIEINLLPGQKKRKAAGAGFKFSLPDFRGLLATIKDPYLIAAVAAWVLALGGGGALFVLDQAQLAALEHRLEDVKAEKRRFDILIANKRKMEIARDSLLAEIIVIRRIDEDRYVWPHLLDQLTKALPPYTWLTGIATIGVVPAGAAVAPPPPGMAAPVDSLGVGTVRIAIDGRTVDIEAFTSFLRQLTASPWLTEVAPTSTTTMIEADRPVTAFNLVARYRPPTDPRFVHTVPLTQSVR